MPRKEKEEEDAGTQVKANLDLTPLFHSEATDCVTKLRKHGVIQTRSESHVTS